MKQQQTTTNNNKQQQKQNVLLSIKRPTMSSIINKKKSQYTIDSHNNFYNMNPMTHFISEPHFHFSVCHIQSGLRCFKNFQQYFSYIVVVSFIGGGNRSNQGKPLTCHK